MRSGTRCERNSLRRSMRVSNLSLFNDSLSPCAGSGETGASHGFKTFLNALRFLYMNRHSSQESASHATTAKHSDIPETLAVLQEAADEPLTVQELYALLRATARQVLG